MKTDRKQLFWSFALGISIAANVMLGARVVRDSDKTQEYSAVLADVPKWLADERYTGDLFKELNTYARTKAQLYIDLYCDGVPAGTCDAKARDHASQVGGKTWERYAELERTEVSLRAGKAH